MLQINDWVETPEGLGQVGSEGGLMVGVRLSDRHEFYPLEQLQPYSGELVPVFETIDAIGYRKAIKGDFLGEWKQWREELLCYGE